MTQLIFDSFFHEEKNASPEAGKNKAEPSILVLILKDFSVAWTDRNWHLHDQDLVYLDLRLALLLAERGIARRTEVS